ncbi:MAG: LysR family transcriptional regulator [Pusillimonas sp.]
MTGRIEEIEVFVRVVEYGSFSATAEKLNLSPSGVSKLIQRLENRLGVQLFYRNSRQLRPTEEGELLYRQGRGAIETLDNAESSVSVRHSHSGILRINTMLTFAKYQLAKVMPEFCERFPGLQIEFVLGAMPIDMLKQGIDLAIHSGAMPDSTLVARPLASSKWILCAAPAYLEKHGVPQSPDDLRQHNCLHFAMATPWNLWKFQGDEQVAREARGKIGADQGDMLLQLALEGMGIVRLAEFHISNELFSGRLVPVLEDFADQRDEPLYMLYRARKNLSPRVEVLIQFLQEKFGGVPPWKTGLAELRGLDKEHLRRQTINVRHSSA